MRLISISNSISKWLRSSSKVTLLKRIPIPLTISLLTACKSSLQTEILKTQPQAHHEAGKTSVYVKGIETNKDLIVIDLLAINAHDEEVELSTSNRPAVLTDSSGEQYVAPEEISLPAYTSSTLKIPFSGFTKGDRELTLEFNSGNDYILRPEMTVDDLVLKAGKRVEFAEYQPSQVLNDTTLHHPNGLTFTVKGMRFGEGEIELSFEAVNGHDDSVEIAERDWDLPFLSDNQGYKYSFVPSGNNSLTIPSQQTSQGILRFAGRVPQSVEQLSLHINEEGSEERRTPRPKIVITGLAGPASTAKAIESETDLTVSNSTDSFPKRQSLNLQANHANGSAIRLSEIVVTKDYLETNLSIVNGHRRAITLNSSRSQGMLMRDDIGNNYYLAPPAQNSEVEVKAGEILQGKFRFLGRLDPQATNLTLIANDNARDFPSTSKPAIAINGISVVDEDVQTAESISSEEVAVLPSPQALNLQANHANGSVMRLEKIAFQEDSVTLDLAIANGHKDEIRLNSNGDMLLRDNIGNVYRLSTLPQNPEVKIPSGQTINGQFVFLGRISPQADSLNLITNERFGGEQDYSNRPKIIISSIPISDSNDATISNSETNNTPEASSSNVSSLPPTQTLEEQVNHSNGSVMRLETVSFQDDSITAKLAITNGHKDEIRLNGNRDFLLRDNLGNVYHLASIPQNPEVKIPSGQTISGDFVFQGRISPQADSFSIITNDRFGGEQDYSIRPKMSINGIAIDRND